jgi:hypothetical protein
MDENQKFAWTQFEKLIDLHKFYFENLIKSATFSFGIIGAIFTYVIKAELSESLVRVSLLLPLILSIGTSVIFFGGIDKAKEFNKWVKQIKGEIPLTWQPHAETLFQMCLIFALLFLAVSICLTIVFFNPSILHGITDKHI